MYQSYPPAGCDALPRSIERRGVGSESTHAVGRARLALQIIIMPKIEKFIIDKILDTARIEEVIQDCLGSYSSGNRGGLKKVGVRYEALCPFHADKSLGSFVVYPKGNCYKCFSCGAKGGVVDFLMNHEGLSYPDAIRWLGKKYNIDVDDAKVDWTYTPRPLPPPLPTLELPKFLMVGTTDPAVLTNDNLISWIKTEINWDSVQRQRIDEMIAAYNVGHGKNGHTIFWQCDERDCLRTGKMMKYRPNGHRDKESSWNFDWIHSTLSRKRREEDPWPFPMLYDPDKQEARLTYFGMHLLDRWKRNGIAQTVCIVESEKTALLMAIAYGNSPKQLWIACGGLEMLTRERLKPLIDQGRRIVLYPDRDGIAKWKVKAAQLGYDRLTVDTTPVVKWWKPCDGDKADIADVVVRSINESRQLRSLDDVKQVMPCLAPMIKNLNLQITNGNNEK